jgi:hypothetical protein
MDADQNDQQEQDPTEVPPTLKEQIDTAVAVAFGEQGYLVEGEPSNKPLADVLERLVLGAEVEKTADRGDKAITKSALVKAAFPNVAGPDAWDEQPAPDVAAGLYSRLTGTVWRLVNDDVTGNIQQRLNGDHGLILCRTDKTPSGEQGVYVTRNIGCVIADFSGPHKAKLKKQADNFAANLAMATGRMPEHAKKFKSELSSGVKTALGSGVAILQPALEAATAEDDDAGDDDE